MTFVNTAWAIDGPQIPSSLARRAIYVASSGNEGIVRGGDLKATATSPASDTVNIANGSALILCRSVGADGQAYTVRNDGQDSITLNATGGASRSDLIIVKVRDPEFPPWDPPPAGEEDTYQYVMLDVIYDVPADTVSFADLGLTYSAYAIARVDRPAGTALVTSAQIVDLRALAQDHFTVKGNNIACSGSDLLNILPPMTWEHFPDTAHFLVDIPSWATRALVAGFVEGLITPGEGQGALSVQVNGNRSELTNFSVGGGAGRVSYNLGGVITIPEDIRGTTQGFFLEGRIADSGSAGCLQCNDGQTNFQLIITFFEDVS